MKSLFLPFPACIAVCLSAVLPASAETAQGYVSDGLVLHYDAIDNAGVGEHSETPSVWKDLSGNGNDLTLPTSGLTVGADSITFDHVLGDVAGVECLAEAAGTPEFTLEVVCAASENFDGTSDAARTVAANPRVSLYFRKVGSEGLVGGIYHADGKRYFAGAPVRNCEWNSTQFIRSFHTYSLRTKSTGGSVAVDGSDYATLQASFYNSESDATDRLTVGSSRELYKVKSVRLYSRSLTVAEAARNAAVDEARFSLKPPADAKGNANAFDDAAFFFRGARQALDPFLDDYEFANALYVGSAFDPAGDKFKYGGYRSNIAVETIDVPAPYSGKILKNRSVVHFTQPYKPDDKSKVETSYIALMQPVAATNKASYTVILRFKLESRIDPAENATGRIQLLQLGYGYSAESGLALQLLGPSDNLYVKAVHGTGVDEFTAMQTDSSATLKAGEWVDMALTVNGRENRLYYKTEGGAWYEGVNNTDVALTKATWGLYKLALGGPADETGVGTTRDSLNNECFRGWYQQVAIWDRALSREEVLNAFCDGCAEEDDWKVGVANDMSLEFAGDGAADLTSVNDWKNMKGSLESAGDSVGVNFELAADSAVKMRTFKLKTTSFSSDGTFSLAVNNRMVAADVESVAGQSATVVVPGAAFVAGANTLTVTRTDSGAGKMDIDCLSLVAAEGNIDVTTAAAGDPLGGAYRWFRHDGDSFRDVLRTSLPVSSAHKWTVVGPASNISCVEVPVSCPYRAVELPAEKCLYFAQESYTNSSGVIYGKGGCMFTAIFPVSNAVAYTAFVRFKIESFQNLTNIMATVFGADYDWSNSRGMCVALHGSDPDNLTIRLSGGRTNLQLTDARDGEEKNRLCQGKWIDLAVVVSNNCGRAYTCVEGGDFLDFGNRPFGSGGMGTPGTWSGMYLGHSSGRSATSWSKDDKDKQYFRGWIHQAAIWPYALSEKDVRAVFGFPRPDVVRVGVENGSAAEFKGSAATSYECPENADFTLAPTVIRAGGQLELSFDLEAQDLRNQIFRIASTAFSSEARFAVSVNGERIVNYTEDYDPYNEFAVTPGWYAEVGIPARLLREGSNTLTVLRIDSDDGAFEIDAMSFGNRGERVRVRQHRFSIKVR